MRKRNVIIGLLLVLLVVGAFALYTYFYKNSDTTYNGKDITPSRATITGTFVCLPHKDTSGPQTMECAFGLKTSGGNYYALDFDMMSQDISELSVGDIFTASGTITPLELLNTDQWNIYDIVGIFSVTSLVKKTE